MLSTLEKFGRFNYVSSRRDSLFKLIHYTVRIIHSNLSTDKAFKLQHLQEILKKIDAALGAIRHGSRLFMSFESLKNFLVSCYEDEYDLALKTCTILCNFFRLISAVCDCTTWFIANNIFQGNKPKIFNYAAKCWMSAVVLNIYVISRRIHILDSQMSASNTASSDQISQSRKLKRDLCKSFLDLALPLHTLSYCSSAKSTLCGLISSILTVQDGWSTA